MGFLHHRLQRLLGVDDGGNVQIKMASNKIAHGGTPIGQKNAVLPASKGGDAGNQFGTIIAASRVAESPAAKSLAQYGKKGFNRRNKGKIHSDAKRHWGEEKKGFGP